MRFHGQAIENDFTRGLITEATGLNFPAHACTETFNCVFHEKAEVRRRLGLDYEDGYAFGSVVKSSASNYVVTEYVWDNVAGLADFSFSVIQVGKVLHFWQINTSGSLSANKKAFTVNLDDYSTRTQVTWQAVDANPGSWPCQFSAANGFLVVTHPYCDPFFVEYNNNAITATRIVIKVRDFEGDTTTSVYGSNYIPITERKPKTYTDPSYLYNLWNKGWYLSSTNTTYGVGAPVAAFQAYTGKWPSFSDVWWTSLNQDDTYDPKLQVEVGSSEAPNGHYILDAFFMDRQSIYAGAKVTSSLGARPSTTAFFAGRSFYGGVSSQGYHNKIYFTQILQGKNDFPKCHQQEDPTNRDSAGLIASDGGIIVIPEIGTIVKLLAVQGFLLVFCSNGIWAITGGSNGAGFVANDYNVQKISDIASISPNSFVIPKTGLPVWWNADGIFTMQLDQSKNGLEVVSLTDSTIKSLYDEIPVTSKPYVKGAYNPLQNIIQWVYRSTEAGSNLQKYEFDSILSLNLTSGAFYPWQVGYLTGGPTINGILCTKGSGTVQSEDQIVKTDGTGIVDASGDPVNVFRAVSVPLTSSFRYTSTVFVSNTNYNITFAQEKDDTYHDWRLYNGVGVDYESYFITGYNIQNDYNVLDRKRPFGVAKFQAGPIYVYSNAEEGSSCFLQGLWDYSIDDSSGKYTTTHQIYKDKSFRGVQRSKNRLRGRGHSLQLKFFSESYKPFRIIGWGSYGDTGDMP